MFRFSTSPFHDIFSHFLFFLFFFVFFVIFSTTNAAREAKYYVVADDGKLDADAAADDVEDDDAGEGGSVVEVVE